MHASQQPPPEISETRATYTPTVEDAAYETSSMVEPAAFENSDVYEVSGGDADADTAVYETTENYDYTPEFEPADAAQELMWTVLLAVVIALIVVAVLWSCVVLIGVLVRLRGYDWQGCWQRFPCIMNGNDSMAELVERAAPAEAEEDSVDSDVTVAYDINEEEVNIQGLAQAILEPPPAAKPVEAPRKRLAKDAEEPRAAVMGRGQPINVERGVREVGGIAPRREGARTRSMGGIRREEDEIFYDII